MMRYIETLAIVAIKLAYGMMLVVVAFSAGSETLIQLIAVGVALALVIDAYAGGRIIYEQIEKNLEEARRRKRGLSDSRLHQRPKDGQSL